jgi:hypothetical protein
MTVAYCFLHTHEHELHFLQLLVANTSLKILNICYTNHALDAFLEDLEAGGITDIVRIGGKSKSDKMEKYQLRELTVSTVCLLNYYHSLLVCMVRVAIDTSAAAVEFVVQTRYLESRSS